MKSWARRMGLALLAMALVLAGADTLTAGVSREGIPDRYGLSILWGTMAEPVRGRTFFLANGFALLDYERVWGHRAPPGLRFKIEASLGGSADDRFRLMASAGIMAFQYLPLPKIRAVHPYIEAGVGLIYSDFRVRGQGLNVNFNPQAGLGFEVGRDEDRPWILALRVHHMSNGGLHPDNRGVNSGVIQIGRYF